MRNNKEKGVLLIITFFVLTIVLAVVLAISTILYGEIKIVRNIGNSVVAFYAADGGVEKVLYFQRNVLKDPGETPPEEIGGGLCYMCLAENLNKCEDCYECEITPVVFEGCDSITCKNCKVTFSTDLSEEKKYEVETSVWYEDNVYNFSVNSTGTYQGVKRAVKMLAVKNRMTFDAPTIENACLLPSRSVSQGIELSFRADITDPDGINNASVYAHVQSPDEEDADTVLMGATGSEYTGTWVGLIAGAYFVDILACDVEDHCAEAENISAICPTP